MPKAKPEKLDVLDDVVNEAPEGVTADTSNPAGGGQTDASAAFVSAAEEAVGGDWRVRRDAWDHTVFNPEFHLHEERKNADGTYRSRRTSPDAQARPQASRITSTRARPLPISTVEMFLISSHMMMAGAFDLPEMKLDKDDANNLAVPIVKVAALYDVKVDPRLEAYGMLIIAIAGVYGPKVGAIIERLRAERARNVTGAARPPSQSTAKGGTVAVLRPTPVPPTEAVKPAEGGGPPPLSPDAINKLFGGDGV